MIKLDISKATPFLSAEAVASLEPQVKAAQQALEAGTCAGNDFLGWLHLPSSITLALFLPFVKAQYYPKKPFKNCFFCHIKNRLFSAFFGYSFLYCVGEKMLVFYCKM